VASPRCEGTMRMLLKRNIILPIVTFFIVALSSGVFTSESSALEIFNNVSVFEARRMLDERNLLKVHQIIDVRTGGEYAQSHIKDAILTPLLVLPERLDEIKKGKSVLVYCSNGNRSKIACEILSSKAYKHLFNMLGGIEAWIEKGYEIVE
jgi:rhodanese-related sulfurtransferase